MIAWIQIGVPARAYFVRKRWDGGGAHLVHLTEIVRLDAFAEAVWDQLDGRSDLDAIGDRIATIFPAIEAELRDALIAHHIAAFAQRGLLDTGGR
ncbi:MAG: PqqD family protein [Alphaproteobacteria bacterium]|nr:PqqD family protein [Alphaproteobacteria bacterium]MBF0374279.1 PqqD family protein [Alphaproteobacteria bacterium]